MIRPFKLPDNKVPIKVGDESYIYKDVYNPIEWFNGEPYRPRVETLVLQNNGTHVYAHITKKGYRIPGGSIDKDSSYEKQAENETNEEALIGVKDLKYSGISYTKPMDRDFIKKGGDSALAYVGSLNYVYVANWDGTSIDRNTIEEKDLDDDMATKGAWQQIDKLDLDREHMEALVNSGMLDKQVEANLRMKLDESSYKNNKRLIFENGNDLGPLKKRYIFHGSMHKFDIFHPMSLDLGNVNEKPGWSTFCFDNIEYAKRFALFRAIQKQTETLKRSPFYRCGWDLENNKPYINQESFDDACKRTIGTPLYIYTIDASKLELGVGNDERFPEYTFRKDNVPYEIREVIYVDKDMMTNCVTVNHYKAIDEMVKRQTENMSELNRGYYARMLNRDYYSDTAVPKLLAAVDKGELKPGDDVEQYMRDHNIELKDVSYYEHLQESVTVNNHNKEMTIYLGDNRVFMSPELLHGIQWNINEISEILPTEDELDQNDMEVYKYYLYETENGIALVGFCDVILSTIAESGQKVYVPRVYVYPRYRRLGVGDVLANYAIRYIISELDTKDGTPTMSFALNRVASIKGIDKWIQSKGLIKLKSDGTCDRQVYSRILSSMFPESIEQFEVTTEAVGSRAPRTVRLYHASPIQGLTQIVPKHKTHNVIVGNREVIYASDDPRFSACFGVDWNDDIAKQGTWDDWNTVTFGVSDKVDLDKPCSMYELVNDGNFTQIKNKEFITNKPAKVKNEVKFNTGRDMIDAYGVELITLDEYKRRLSHPVREGVTNKLDLSDFTIHTETEGSINRYYWTDKGGSHVAACSVEHGIGIFNLIYNLHVDDKYRRNGLGKQVLDYAVKTGKGNSLSVYTDNDIAIDMYKKYGFKIGKASEDDVKAGKSRMYFMHYPPAMTSEERKKANETKIDHSTEGTVYDLSESLELVTEEQADMTNLLYYKATKPVAGENLDVTWCLMPSLYSSSIKEAIQDEIDFCNENGIPLDDKKFTFNMYTLWDNSRCRMIGQVTVYWHGDHFDWEWETQASYSPEMIDYIRDVQMSIRRANRTDVVEESWEDNKFLKPIYIILTYAGTRFGKLITSWQHCKFSHAGLSLSSKMDKVYTFNMRTEYDESGRKKVTGGADIENLNDYYNPAENNDADICVMAMFVPADVHATIKNNIEKIFANREKTKYSISSVINVVLNRAVDTKDTMKMICSQFVDYIIKSVGIDISNKASNITTPNDFYKAAESNPDIFLLYEGKKSKYNPKSIDRKMGYIRHSDKYSDINIARSLVAEAFTQYKGDFQKGKPLSLPSFTKTHISKQNLYRFRSQELCRELRHIDDCDTGYIYTDGGKFVAVVAVDTSDDRTYNWITAIEVGKDYQGHGLAKQLLDVAVKELGGNALSAHSDNKVAIDTYKKYGFKESKESKDKMKTRIFMYYGDALKESFDGYIGNVLTENVIFNKDNTLYNTDKFDSGKSNILLVTGLSGSGKSTLAQEYAKKVGAEWIELDIFEHCYEFKPENLKQAGEVFYEYLSARPKLWEKLRNKELVGKELGEEIRPFVKYCIKWCRHHKEKKWVIEGVQIYSMLSADEVKGYPLVILGTSMKNSIIQRFRRDSGGKNIEWGEELKNDFPGLLKWYWGEEKELKRFEKDVKDVMETVYQDVVATKEWYYRDPNNGINNCLVNIKGHKENFRGRGEMIIFNKAKTKIFLCKVGKYSLYHEFGYRLPGGSFEPGEPHIDGVRREVAEEVRMLTTDVVDMEIRYAFTYDKPADWVQEKLPKDAWWYGSYVEVFCGVYDGEFKGNVADDDVDQKMIDDGEWVPINNKTLQSLTKWHREAVQRYLGTLTEGSIIKSLNLLLEADDNDDEDDEATDYTKNIEGDDDTDNDDSDNDSDENHSDGEATSDGDQATDYTDDADNDDATDYTADVGDDEPAEQSNQPESDTSNDDTENTDNSGDEQSTDNASGSDSSDSSNSTEISADDEGGGATDYTAMGDSGDDSSESNGDSESSDETDDTSNTDGTDNQSINNRIKNYSILKDFERLYRLASEIGESLDPIIMEKPIQNKVVTQVKENIVAIKNAIMWFVQYGISAKYSYNLYYYEIFMSALKLNVQILEKNKLFSEELKKQNKKS